MPFSPSHATTRCSSSMNCVPLHRLYRRLRQESVDTHEGISPFQNLLLVAILKHPGIGVGELARMEKLRGPTISGHIGPMETAGLVRAVPDPHDRRRAGLHLTDKGRDLIETLRNRRRDWLAGQLALLPPEARQAIRGAIGPLTALTQ
ncbi:MarR family winged helix-turn-helix transcriptional regulator [Labrys monachus]|uniref:DNA-binding MarR family transcriptional regulator n=1 Tax=Labrys monachus TaxID=217067 RepID=A0ABU0FBR5_9HYPH|nr:MarR family winged helix-turn-helix transcriptional regulator [Labrys monachus]MDQ0391876.1 DNA-binding MarR family transcriptional regulator [Labrys monachus]